MKKKALILLLSASLIGCGGKVEKETTAESNVESLQESKVESLQDSFEESIESAVESLGEEIQNEINEITESYEPQEVTVSLQYICEQLESSNLVYGEKIEMAGDMIGAISGVKYKDLGIEIYEYDTNSEVYSSVESNKKATIQGFNMDMKFVSVVNGYALYTESDNQDLVSSFEDICK